MTRKKPSAQVEKFYIDINYPFWDFVKHFGEGHSNTLKTAQKKFDEWVESLKAEGKTAVVKLVEIRVKVHKAVIVSGGHVVELQDDAEKWEFLNKVRVTDDRA